MLGHMRKRHTRLRANTRLRASSRHLMAHLVFIKQQVQEVAGGAGAGHIHSRPLACEAIPWPLDVKAACPLLLLLLLL